MYNKAVIGGRLVKDPDEFYTLSGKKVVTFRVAVNNGKNRSGKDLPPTYLNVTTFGRLADNAEKYLKKGRAVLVEGRLVQNVFEGRDGKKRRLTKIIANRVVFLGPGKNGGNGNLNEEEDEENIEPF